MAKTDNSIYNLFTRAGTPSAQRTPAPEPGKCGKNQNQKKPRKNKSVPQIRFPGFTEPWVERRFGDLVQTRRGLTYKPSDVRKRGVRVLRSSNIDEDVFRMDENDVFVDENAINIEYAKTNDILITSANGSSRLVGKHAIISEIPDKSTVHGGFMLIGTAEEPYFINASMSSSWYKNFINLSVLGGNGAIGNLRKHDLDEQVILVPSKAEQQKIGAYFKNLDNLIAASQREVEGYQKLKQGMLQKMFPKEGKTVPEIRFPKFSGPWEERELEELGNIITGSTPPTIHPEYYSPDGIPWVTGADISENITFETARKLSDAGQKVARVVPKNTILVTCIGAGIGKSTMLGVMGSFNQQINGLVPNEEKYDPYFLFTESALWSAQMKKTACSGTMPIVKKSEFSKIKTLVPTLAEQQKIGAYFQNLDNLISASQDEVEGYRKLKEAMLEKMFV